MLFSYRSFLWACAVLGSSLSAGLTTLLLAFPASAQSRLPACPPPADQEYLLLVRGKTEAERSEIASILPAANPVLVCQYRDETLVRAGGFTSLETANAWATYMTTVGGFESFVSKPSSQVAAQPSDPSATQASSQSSQTSSQTGSQTSTQTAVRSSGTVAYQPSRLASGYAVLVNYGAQPEIATAVGQIVRPVGLAIYRQQAYLLADYTNDADSAAATLQRLSDAQLTAIVVDAQEVVRLTAEVAR